MKKIKKILNKVINKAIGLIMYFDSRLYMNIYLGYLKKIGIGLEGVPKFISNDCYFDGKDYSLITIGDNVTVSREVMFLTHDYSIATVEKNLSIKERKILDEMKKHGNILILKGIKVGNNSFIGARASLLPGTEIGQNVIIGAGSVVRGKVPDNSIVVGNPAKVIGFVSEWIDEKIRREKLTID